MNPHAAAGLHEEVRRLRLRITSLATSPHREHSLDAVLGEGRTRRQAVREALDELAVLSLAGHPAPATAAEAVDRRAPAAEAMSGREPAGSSVSDDAGAEACAGAAGAKRDGVPPVPDLGDRVLADQLVVLLLDCAPEYGADPAVTEKAHDLAVTLRRGLG